jgi:inosose dehydratase
MRLAYGNYGMPHTPVSQMITDVAAIGYDGLEWCAAPGYPTAPDQLDAAARRAAAQQLVDVNLPIASIMVAGVRVLEPDVARHQENLDYLRSVLALRQALGAEVEISSTLGGQRDAWEQDRNRMAACVDDWARTCGEFGAEFAMEPHVNGLIDSPERACWLLDEVANPHLRLNFDYSHFELIDIPLQTAIDMLIPYAAGVHVKDVRGRAPEFRFLLPGEGTLDYADYLTRVQRAGYSGFITVEISGQIFKAAGYDAHAAARFAYDHLAQAFTNAGITRRRA